MPFNQDLVSILKSGGVGVIATDTIYGLVGQALKPEVVARIYSLKKRDLTKPLIILISAVEDLAQFGVVLTSKQEKWVAKYWPGPVSLIFNTSQGSLAFRLPAKEDLRELLRQTGPLVAPSANPSSLAPAKNITEATNYFGDQVDFYVDGGELIGQPSKLIDLTGEEEKILRN